MRRILPVLVVVTLALPSVAIAGGPGVNVRWDNCFDGSPGPNGAHLGIAVTVPSTALAVLDPGVEYISGRLRINNLKTTGTGACAGCTEPVCIYFSMIDIATPVLANNLRITTGANGVASQIATWQSGLVTNLAPNCGLVGCFPTFDCVLDPSTSARNSTWGAVKSLYR
jgi:hypothetical protein